MKNEKSILELITDRIEKLGKLKDESLAAWQTTSDEIIKSQCQTENMLYGMEINFLNRIKGLLESKPLTP